MAQGYYTLQQAAQVLNMSVDELKQMAQKGQIRSFQDRGTLRFRVQDVQELARSRGVSSDPDGIFTAPPPKSGGSPKSGAKKQPPASPKSPPRQQRAEAAPEVFSFNIDDTDDSVDLGADLVSGKGGSKGKPSSKGKRATPPPAGSDSDVRLVPDGSDVNFSIPRPNRQPPDSDVKVPSDPLKPRSDVTPGTSPGSGGRPPSGYALDSGAQPKSKTVSPKPGQTPQPIDSGVRLVPLDSDSDVKLVGSSDEVPLGESGPSATSDSNVRLDKVSLPPADSHEDAMLLTEEINLDEEIQKQQEKEKDKPSTKLKAKSELKLPSASPFELSDSDLELPSELKGKKSGPKTPVKAETKPSDSSDFDLAAKAQDEDSSDFDVAAQKDGSSDFDLVPADGGSRDFTLEGSSSGEEVLQDDASSGGFTSSKSGISLQNPVDSGISLEEDQASDEVSDFDMSLEAEEDTPRPKKSAPAEDSSEFELKAQKTPRPSKKAIKTGESSDDIDLSLHAEDDAPTQDDDSEFEINLDASDESPGAQSDSEFELTLDDSGDLKLDEDAPQVKSKKKGGDDEDEKDIFDTDFEVPALDESDDATVADSELESSDFDIALDDSDLANEEESGSQVVALDEEGEQETAADDDGAAVVDDVEVEEESSDFADLDDDVEVEDDDVEVEAEAETQGRVRVKTVVEEKLIEPAQWGVMPVIFMLPCVIIMFFAGIIGFEAVQTSAGLRPPGPVTSAFAGIWGQKASLKSQ